MKTEEGLKTIGFSANEAKVYLATLELGESTVLPIAQKSGLPRTYCYDILDSLVERGNVSYIEKRGRRRYSAIQPRLLKQIALDQFRNFDSVLPDLESLYQQAPARPRVRFFEGKEGLVAIHNETLAEAREILVFGSTEQWIGSFDDYFEFIRSLVKKGIKIKDLTRKMPETLKYKELYKEPLQEMRFIRDSWDFMSDCVIWGNKIALLSYGQEMHGIVIESKDMAQSMNVVFRILWEQSKKS